MLVLSVAFHAASIAGMLVGLYCTAVSSRLRHTIVELICLVLMITISVNALASQDMGLQLLIAALLVGLALASALQRRLEVSVDQGAAIVSKVVPLFGEIGWIIMAALAVQHASGGARAVQVEGHAHAAGSFQWILLTGSLAEAAIAILLSISAQTTRTRRWGLLGHGLPPASMALAVLIPVP